MVACGVFVLGITLMTIPRTLWGVQLKQAVADRAEGHPHRTYDQIRNSAGQCGRTEKEGFGVCRLRFGVLGLGRPVRVS